MKLYYVKDNYIEYLRKFDSRIYMNKEQSRPYIGIVFQINNINYYAPLSSPKNKHLKMKNSKDFRKINGGKYGAINFNYMIPVPKSEILEVDIDNEPDVKYRRLLQNQISYIKNDCDRIINTANGLYNLFLTDNKNLTPNEANIKNRCCNFLLLEEKYKQYKSQ